MKNYFKVIWRSFAKNAAKLISLTVIMALGIAFVAGLGTLSPTILDAIDAELEASSAPDFIIKSHSPLGFTEEQRDKIASLSFVTATDAVTVADMDNDANTRIYVYSSFDTTLNELEIEGEVPSAAGEVLVERQNNYTEAYSAGDKITVLGAEYTVTGIVSNPLIFDRLGEPDTVNTQPLEKIVYFSAEYFPLTMLVTDVYASADALRGLDRFSYEYEERAEEYAAELSA